MCFTPNSTPTSATKKKKPWYLTMKALKIYYKLSKTKTPKRFLVSFAINKNKKRFQRHWRCLMNHGFLPIREKPCKKINILLLPLLPSLTIIPQWPPTHKKRVRPWRWALVFLPGQSLRSSRRVILVVWAGSWCNKVLSANIFCHSLVQTRFQRSRVTDWV